MEQFVMSEMMSEAEVALLLAFWLFEHGHSPGPVDVAIDGAQVKSGETVHFGLEEFMGNHGWMLVNRDSDWRGEWGKVDKTWLISIHSRPGRGDVVAPLGLGGVLRVESKKGPLTRTRSSPEYPLIREALGQLLTVSEVGDRDVLAVAVPNSPKFRELAERWREAPLIRKFSIRILTVGQDGCVLGF